MMKFKALIEKRNEIVEKINESFRLAEQENRAFSQEEKADFEAKTAEIKAIDETLKMHEEARSMDKAVVPADSKDSVNPFELESRAFANYVRSGKMESRDGAAASPTDVNWTTGDNGAVIPSTIANKIIETVENIAPIFTLATRYNVKGSLSFPVYDESTQKIEADYATEFTALTSTAGKFTNVSLGGFLVGALTKISKSLINNSQFDITSYVITKMSQAIARFLEHELLLGAGTTAMTGVMVAISNGQTQTAAAANAIAANDLIALQLKVPQVYQAKACWIMNTNTLLAIRKLQDGDNRYLLNDDIRNGFGYTLLGKPVYISDNVADIATGAKTIAYGDFSGLYCNLRPNIEMQLLQEKYADEHAVGVVAWFEADSKIVEPQKIAVLKMA